MLGDETSIRNSQIIETSSHSGPFVTGSFDGALLSPENSLLHSATEVNSTQLAHITCGECQRGPCRSRPIRQEPYPPQRVLAVQRRPSTHRCRRLCIPHLKDRCVVSPGILLQHREAVEKDKNNSEVKGKGCLVNIHLSTTVTSTDLPSLLSLNLSPQSGFAFGFEPLLTASYKTCDTAQIFSLLELVIPQDPSAGS